MSFRLGDDIIDSRDIISRIEELESERDDLICAFDELQLELDDCDGDDLDEKSDLEEKVLVAEHAIDEWNDDNGDELKSLKTIEGEFSGYGGDWKYGETLIEDGHFEDYARELAEEVCDMRKASSWPFSCIDWEEAADELKHDYMSVDVDEYTYWMRA